MKRILGGIFLSVLFFGCRQAQEPPRAAIALCCAVSEGSKAEALTAGEEVAVYACPEGTEDYFLEAAKFTVGADGRSLTYGSTVYYPDPKQAVRFFAYFPYHQGTFSVPTDQSTALALKQADLCGAMASTTPVATPVSLEFRHLLARLVITTNKPTTKIVFPNAIASGVLHAATAELVLGAERKDIGTEKNELIVPAQPLSRLVLTVANVEYVFEPTLAITLEMGETTTLYLTLHPATHTATLSGSNVTDWGSVGGEGNPSPAVSNTLLLHWPSYVPQGAAPDQVIFTIGGADYAVSNGITYANHTFTVPFTSSVLRYPYTISKIRFYQSNHLVQSCSQLLGSTIYKAGNSTIGINPNAVKVGDLWWATGNLVASNAVAGARGFGGCRIGEPMDGGLYFQFGSLIGWKGGALANGGTGIGMPLLTTNDTYWNGETTWRWANDAMVWPVGMIGNPTSWPQDQTTNQWYFGLQTGWSTIGQNIRDFLNFTTGGLANVGVGDPCTYYLGGTWRLPLTTDYAALFGNVANSTAWGSVAGWDWQATPPGAKGSLFFPASGRRYHSNGSFHYVTVHGDGLSSSVSSAIGGHSLAFNSGNVTPQNNNNRSFGFPVRCVSE